MEHDAAVEIHVIRSIRHHLAFEAIFHAQNVMRVGEIGEKVAELAAKFVIAIVGNFQDAVLDAKGVVGICTEWMAGDFGRPAIEVFAIEQADPAIAVLGVERRGEKKTGEDGEFQNWVHAGQGCMNPDGMSINVGPRGRHR